MSRVFVFSKQYTTHSTHRVVAETLEEAEHRNNIYETHELTIDESIEFDNEIIKNLQYDEDGYINKVEEEVNGVLIEPLEYQELRKKREEEFKIAYKNNPEAFLCLRNPKLCGLIQVNTL